MYLWFSFLKPKRKMIVVFRIFFFYILLKHFSYSLCFLLVMRAGFSFFWGVFFNQIWLFFDIFLFGLIDVQKFTYIFFSCFMFGIFLLLFFGGEENIGFFFRSILININFINIFVLNLLNGRTVRNFLFFVCDFFLNIYVGF